MLLLMKEGISSSNGSSSANGHRRPARRRSANASPTPPLTESPPSSNGGLHSPSRPEIPEGEWSETSITSFHSLQSIVEQDHDRDIEASESSIQMEDESLQDDFLSASENDLNSSSSRRSGQGLHSSLSALHSARRHNLLHRQSSFGSLPVTMDDSFRMRKRVSSSKIRPTASSSPRKLPPSSSPRRLAATSPPPPLQNFDDDVRTAATAVAVKCATRRPFRALLLLGLLFLAMAATCIHHRMAPIVRPFWIGWTQSRRAARHPPFREILLQLGGVDRQRLLDPTSDAYKALDWMANDDPAKPTPTLVASQLVQRWALATLWFATHRHPTDNDDDWRNSTRWMTAACPCTWHGIECEILSQSDWFEATLGNGDSVSDAGGVLGDASSPEQQQVREVVAIHMSGNNVQGTLPPEIRHLSNLESVDFSRNRLTGSLPRGDAFGHFLRLTDLKLDGNRLTGELPDAVGFNLILKRLHLDHNQLRGTIPEVWGHNLRNLREWTMGGNFFTGTIPTTINGLKHLQVLEWNDNHITGSLPFSLCTVTTLKTVRLEFNSINGSIPSEFIMSARELEVLDLGYNQLTGHVPDAMPNPSHLKRFHAHHNELSGRLPTTVGFSTHMTSLRLDHNQFSGWIPIEWQRLEDLQILRLQNNKLGGKLPPQLARLSKLEEFQFQNNLLQPIMPKKMLLRLFNLQHHSIGLYISDARNQALDAELMDEQSRMKRQQEMGEEKAPSFSTLVSTNPELVATERNREEGLHAEAPLLSLVENLQDLHSGAPPENTVDHHFDEEEM